MDGLGVGGHGGLLESLGEGRVSVAGAGNILAGSAILEGKGTLSNHLTGVGADDVNTENTVGLGVGDHLDHTLSVEVGLGAGVGAEGEGTDAVGDTGLLELLLGLANPGNLGEGVHDRGNAAVVDVAVTLLDVLNGSNGLLLGLVGKHGAEGDITNAANVGDLGAVLGVDDDTAALVLLEANVLEAETLGVGAAANSDKNDVTLELCSNNVSYTTHNNEQIVCRVSKATHSLGLATLGGVDLELDDLASLVTGNDLGAGFEVDALLLQDLLDGLGDLKVHAGATNLFEELDDGDLGAETGPDGSHLETNDTTTDDEHLLGDLLKSNGASAADDALLVDLEAGEGGDLGASGDKDVLALDGGLAAVVELDVDGVLIGESAGALDVLDAVLLEEELNTLGETADGLLLGLHELGKVELDIADLDTAVFRVVEDLVVEMGVVEERLGGNAADVQAGTAEGAALLDTGDLYPGNMRDRSQILPSFVGVAV